MERSRVVPLTESRIDDAAGVPARAFVADPGLMHVLPDPAQRARLAPVLARGGLQFAARCGAPLITAEPVLGVAIWFPPDAAPPTHVDLATSGIARVPSLLGDRSWSRLKSMLEHLDELHSRTVPGPHWYLTVLGVDPDWQRRGIGELLMRPVFDAANRDNVPCYLEAPTEGNARYYERRGFVVVGETDVPGSAVHVWLMRRDPVA